MPVSEVENKDGAQATLTCFSHDQLLYPTTFPKTA